MQLFIRDPSGSTTAFTASTPLELQSQVFDALNLPSASTSEVRLSRRSRTLLSSSSTAASFEELSISPYSTIDVSFRLRGGGPKKRCAHVFVKASSNSSASNTPSSSGVATPTVAAAPAPAPAAVAGGTPAPVEGEKKEVKEGEAAKEDDETMKTDGEVQASGPVSVVPPVSAEPILERCGNAALRMVGECPKCTKNFCGQHRLPEDHACPALQTFRKAAFDENMKRLNKEATFTSKISAF